MKEKTRYKRLGVSLPVRYRLGPGGIFHKTNTVDIREDGICIGPVPLSDEWMLATFRVELEISLPSCDKPLQALATVLMIEQAKRPHHIFQRWRYNIHLTFCEISEEDKNRFKGFAN